jgi:hypothetical protein
MISELPPSAGATSPSDATVQHLLQVASKGLPQMVDPEHNLFCYAMKRKGSGLVRNGLSHRYTVITLMGLKRLEESGATSCVGTTPLFEKLFADLSWVDNIGDLGLLMWLCATTAPQRLGDIEQQLPIGSALKQYPDAPQGRTMELAWFLTGLCEWALRDSEKKRSLRELAFDTYKKLLRNHYGGPFFGHLDHRASASGLLRGPIGSFADQVYPIFALCRMYQAFTHDKGLKLALNCGRGICDVQGDLGQWWWHYDARAGEIAEGYPVFSVHQHGMAPMTLFVLGEASGEDFSRPIQKGLEWIDGRNELMVNMEDAESSVIWRCLYRPRIARFRDLLRGKLAGWDPQSTPVALLQECRPYELGWLLFAWAGKTNSR